MAVDLSALDPYSAYLRVTLVEATPQRAVVEQPADSEVDNHVKVRHASALYTAAHEAARQLVLAALGDRASSAQVRLLDSEIAYTQVGLGVLTSTAEPRGGDWDSVAGELETSVVTTDPDGKVVVELTARWAVNGS